MWNLREKKNKNLIVVVNIKGGVPKGTGGIVGPHHASRLTLGFSLRLPGLPYAGRAACVVRRVLGAALLPSGNGKGQNVPCLTWLFSPALRWVRANCIDQIKMY